MSKIASSRSGGELLVEWANGQDPWVRLIASDVLAIRKPPSEDRLDTYYQVMLVEKQLEPGEPIEVPAVQVPAAAAVPEKSLVLTSVSRVENVNALSTGQTLSFNPRLTVLYGENGVGKTGYVRLLKTVASVRTAEAILPNIHSPASASQPSACIAYREGDAEEAKVEWKGQKGAAPLQRIDVFDTASVALHVDPALNYVYTPFDVATFGLVHDAIKAVKERLDKAAKERLPTGNRFTTRFSRDGSLYSVIETLGPTTELAGLEQLAQVSDAEEEGLAMLEEQIEALRGSATDARLSVVTAELDVLGRTKAALDSVLSFASDRYQAALARWSVAQEAASSASRERLRDSPIPGVDGPLWRNFVEAADRYMQKELGEGYPRDGAACIFCLQPLEAAAVSLIKKYGDVVRGRHQAAVQASELELSGVSSALIAAQPGMVLEEVRRKEASAVDQGERDLWASAARVMELAVAALDVVIARGIVLPANLYESACSVAERLTQRIGVAEGIAASLSGEVGIRRTKLAEATARARLLKDRIALRDSLSEIRQHVECARWSSRAQTLASRMVQVAKSLTEASKSASAVLLNGSFEALFMKECEALRAPPVKLQFPGKDGLPARKKSLAARVHLDDVLSEGEQKVIALADFLAEASLRRAAAPIVFDDPVTSLDYRRLEYVVGRIVELSKERQVIVFTHNIWFTMALLGRFERERESCTYLEVSSDGSLSGLVTMGSSPKTDTWGDRSRRLNGHIAKAKQEKDPDDKMVWVEKGYETLRGACEVMVEQDMLKAVVQSYRPNVMVGKLDEIKVEALANAAKPVVELFNRCCRFLDAHKQPLEVLNVRPRLDELEADWQALQELRKTFTSRDREDKP